MFTIHVFICVGYVLCFYVTCGHRGGDKKKGRRDASKAGLPLFKGLRGCGGANLDEKVFSLSNF